MNIFPYFITKNAYGAVSSALFLRYGGVKEREFAQGLLI
jgi:hypothetical protein